MFTSEIGSVYSPPDKQGMPLPPDKNHVETIVDIGPNSQVSLVSYCFSDLSDYRCKSRIGRWFSRREVLGAS
jgi:hypothetical protein